MEYQLYKSRLVSKRDFICKLKSKPFKIVPLFFEKLKTEIPWQQDDITVFGKTYPQPRLTALFGNEGKPYSYSNIVMQPHVWNSLLLFIKNEIESFCCAFPINEISKAITIYILTFIFWNYNFFQ